MSNPIICQGREVHDADIDWLQSMYSRASGLEPSPDYETDL
ncbi:MAG: hypothetical protein Q9M26_04070 [Mariprofundales bacterium]|nr:hypothetical protein [Mariprofundales bacterium]